MELKHFSHSHPLILKYSKGDVCNGCNKEILGSAYCCEEGYCGGFFLHERCSKLTNEINHLMHSDHPLTLSTHFPHSKWPRCEVCYEMGGLFSYNCKVCDLNVCISCVLQEDQLVIDHKSHRHPLKLILRRVQVFCNACDTEEMDSSYICTTCDFWIHKSCALTPNIIACSGHHHPLLLAYSLPPVNRSFEYDCDICDKKLRLSKWIYHCADCRYFAHVKCARSLNQTLGKDPSKITSEEDSDPSLVHLPVANKSVHSLIQCIKLISLGYSKTRKKLEHWSHDHPLVLHYDQNQSIITTTTHNNNNDDDEDTLLCDGCVLPIISSPFYSCEECNFLLHTSCIHLRPRLQLSSHGEHSVYLGKRLTTYHIFICIGCTKEGNGFFFTNPKEDGIKYCLVCASITTTIKHEAHRHPLVIQYENPQHHRCTGCDQYSYFKTMRGCDTCSKFYLDYTCAMLPRMVTHDWDKHPIYLSYPPFNWHPDEFYCEICEEQINPKCWLYHCRVCDHSFHTGCFTSETTYPKLKYGGKQKFKDHPHALKHVRKKSAFQCNICDQLGYGRALECAPCNFQLCLACADRKLYITSDRIQMAPNKFSSIVAAGSHFFSRIQAGHTKKSIT